MFSAILFVLALPEQDATPSALTAESIRASAERAIPRIEASLAEYARKRDCFACHHQGVGLLALTTARGRGLKVDDDLIRDQTAFTANDLHASLEAYQKGRGQGGATRAGYALWALELGGHAPDETTVAVADYLLSLEKDGWRSASRRPPSESSPFTSTYVALRGVTRFAAPEEKGASRSAWRRLAIGSSRPPPTTPRPWSSAFAA